IAHREANALLQKALDTLPPQRRKVFELSRLEGLKYEEIASQLNVSRETVKRHLSEATKNLRTILGSHHEALALLIVIGLT
ncbi:MAG: sigma-70 family RNA polymerase sigma factor, partial [Chitinophagaceae bacterium]|nr:sigma-70 family RNA polymerase sigma factor [Chitinophagaceae bacterium]